MKTFLFLATCAAAPLLLSGCVTSGINVATNGGFGEAGRSPLVFGALWLGPQGQNVGSTGLAAAVAQRTGWMVTPLSSEAASDGVDVLVRVKTKGGVIETYSVRSKKLLTTGHASMLSYPGMYRDIANHLLTEYAPQKELSKQLVAEKGGGAAPAPAVVAQPAPSLPVSPSPTFSVPERLDDLAVIVGIESYSDIASKATYAERDADAFKAHVRALGVPERNIVLLKGSRAGRASLVKNIEQWLPRLAKADSRVYFYFSGHGAPDVKTGQAYLVPWDGDPNFLESTGYPVSQLYKKLAELPSHHILVAMDSCFSGAGGRSVLASGARPLVAKIDTGTAPAKITVLAASASSEISGALDEKGHGAFTYFLLQGLDSGKSTPKDLADYLTPRVQDEAKRLNRDQTPQLLGDGSWSLR